MKISNHAVDRYRERFNPFIAAESCRSFLKRCLDNSEKLDRNHTYHRSYGDYYLNTEFNIIFAVRQDTATTVYPTPAYEDEIKLMDLNNIYLTINNLRKMLDEYKGHKTEKLKELEDVLNGRNNSSRSSEMVKSK